MFIEQLTHAKHHEGVETWCLVTNIKCLVVPQGLPCNMPYPFAFAHAQASFLNCPPSSCHERNSHSPFRSSLDMVYFLKLSPSSQPAFVLQGPFHVLSPLPGVHWVITCLYHLPSTPASALLKDH